VLGELVGGPRQAEQLVLEEENRVLRLRCAELEGKSATQSRAIEELRQAKRQLIASVTSDEQPSRPVGVKTSDEGGHPVVEHIKTQERLIGTLRELIDQLSTQTSIGQALMGASFN
jgi:uncharacterized coiled-coil protein SlyX